MALDFAGQLSYAGMFQRIGTGTITLFIFHSEEAGPNFTSIYEESGSSNDNKARVPMVVAKNPQFAIRGTVATDINVLARNWLVLRSVR